MSEVTSKESGANPSELYGTHTWRIENISKISTPEIRSNVFEAGGHQWYIIVYPKGCEVTTHLSLFLCVENCDKLLPGWSHLAQFTISLVNKDPKKSKLSDSLHEFWKKEHDWGWKKYIELPKLHDGFIDEYGSLTIMAQVQVIRDRVDRPFPCLDVHYRRELVRVYFKNVESTFLRFMKEKRSKLMEDNTRWASLCGFWLEMDQNSRREMSGEKMDVILKLVVKHFFIKKEVTSSLVMDFLFHGLNSLVWKERATDFKNLPAPIVVSVDKDMFVLVDDAMLLMEKAVLEPLPDERDPQNRKEVSNDGGLADEKLLTEFARGTLEVYIFDHILCTKVEGAYKEAISLKMQEELIREEEENLNQRKVKSTKKFVKN
ncbi:MATH/TRAF domain-containing protein [Hirschfeldia incana]|nr:MATH/TRAF domain-containing protein [Hirschfeldia incana]